MAEAVRPAKKRQKPGKTSTEPRRNSRNAVEKKQTEAHIKPTRTSSSKVDDKQDVTKIDDDCDSDERKLDAGSVHVKNVDGQASTDDMVGFKEKYSPTDISSCSNEQEQQFDDESETAKDVCVFGKSSETKHDEVLPELEGYPEVKFNNLRTHIEVEEGVDKNQDIIVEDSEKIQHESDKNKDIVVEHEQHEESNTDNDEQGKYAMIHDGTNVDILVKNNGNNSSVCIGTPANVLEKNGLSEVPIKKQEDDARRELSPESQVSYSCQEDVENLQDYSSSKTMSKTSTVTTIQEHSKDSSTENKTSFITGENHVVMADRVIERTSNKQIPNIFGKELVSSTVRENVTAFSEDDLTAFYFNPYLANVEDSMEDFVKETLEPRRENEFFELLNTYENSSRNLRKVLSEIDLLQEKCENQTTTLWSTESKTVTAQAMCQDLNKVSYKHSYSFAVFNEDEAKKLDRTLESLKSNVHETFTLTKYSWELARIHVMSYVHDLHAQSPVFCGVHTHSPVVSVDASQISNGVFSEVRHLRDCITALFHFTRKPTDDDIFLDDIKLWLENLIALLLRVASFSDHVFVLNHLLRMPSGHAKKLAHFIQPVLLSRAGISDFGVNFWQHPLLHHFVTMLAYLLLPIKLREKYLIEMKSVLSSENPVLNSWVMLDEDGEEDLDENWMLIQESDIIALFAQFSIDSLYEIIFAKDSVLVVGNEQVNLEIRASGQDTASNLIHLFAFSTCLVKILGKAFELYSIKKYREFSKRLGRMISKIVIFVSRYWLAYKTAYVEKYGENEMTFHFAFGTDYSLEKLQLEYDHFFIRSSQQILIAQKLGVWQFLIDMPFYCLSSSMTWASYRFLHDRTSDKGSLHSIDEHISSSNDLPDTSSLVESFKSMNETEIIFLLTTFSNMACARSLADMDFIRAVSQEIYEITFLSDEAVHFLRKTGKDLLGSICQRHSFIISMLVERVESTLDSVREDCVGLFQALPVEMWRPKVSDIQTIRNWLLRSAVESPEHQLSRYLLTNINWQCKEFDGDVLFLPLCLHRAVAIIVVEICALRLPNRPGGIAMDVFKEEKSLFGQASQLVIQPYKSLMQHFTDQELHKWLWELVMFLHLHAHDRSRSVMQFTATSSLSNETVTSSYEQHEFFKSLSKDEPPDLDNDESLVNILTSAKKDGPLACYVALQMSNYGHDPEKMKDTGLDFLLLVLDDGHVFPACRIIENTIPVFFAPELVSISESTRFTKIIDIIIHSEAQWREEKVVDILSGIIQKHIKKSTFPPDENRSLIAAEFWLRGLGSIPKWNTDTNVLKPLNDLLRVVFRNWNTNVFVVKYFMSKHEKMLKNLKDQSFLSSLLSFVVSNPSSATLLDIQTYFQYTYLCYYVICAESLYQEQCGLKSSLSKKLYDKPDMCMETALKKVLASSKDIVAIPSCNLDIYRWADLAFFTDHKQPILVIIWQKFFENFLHRSRDDSGISEAGSLGLRFFESTANITYLKKLKARLIGTSEYYKENVNSENGTEVLYKKLGRLFQTLSLWLDEPRLHDPTLFIQGLPSIYDSERLARILEHDESLWFDCIDYGAVDYQINSTLRFWSKFYKERQRNICAKQKRTLIKKPERVASHDAIKDVKEPPVFKVLPTPQKECDVTMLMDKYKTLELLQKNVDVLIDNSRKFMFKLSTHSSLDHEYLECLRHMHENVETQLRVNIPCNKQGASKKGCKGAANIVVTFKEKKTNEVLVERVKRNRYELQSLTQRIVHEMPNDICLSALSVEKTLTLLLRQWKSCQNPGISQKFEEIGCSTFYMFIDAMSDTVREFPSTMQFFSTCVDLLGKTFIMDNPTQTEVLLRAILAHPKIVGILLPIFQPSTALEDFTEMYENIIHTNLHVEVKFSLLSKFNFRTWLNSKPTLSKRMSMMKVLFTALCDCGFEPPVQITMLSENYLRKSSVLLKYQFPDLFGETLSLLIHGSANHCLCVKSWNEFLITTRILVEDLSKRELKLNTYPPFLIRNEQVIETISWLTKYFNDQRQSCPVGSNEGLFTFWKPYLGSLSALYEYTSRQSIAAYEMQLSEQNIEVIKFLWNSISDFFFPWISPFYINKQANKLSLPWSEMEEPEALQFVDLYVQVLVYFGDFLPVLSNGRPNILSLVWELYTSLSSMPSLPSHFYRVYHAKFSHLQWALFHPNVTHMESMSQICSSNLKSQSFMLDIVCKIPWEDILEHYRSMERASSFRLFENHLFNILIVLNNDKTFINTKENGIANLIEKATKYDWNALDGITFRSVLDWFVANCDSRQILDFSSTMWNTVRLLENVCLLSSCSVTTQQTYADIPEKRLHYFNSIVKILSKCSSIPDFSPTLYCPIVEHLMDSVLVACPSDPVSNIQAIVCQYMEILNFLNILPAKAKLTDMVLEAIQEKIRDLKRTDLIMAVIIASCHSLTTVSLMVQLVEVAIETHFSNNITYTESRESLIEPWSDVLRSVVVPQLSQRVFVQECINNLTVLTLYTYTVQSLSLCQSSVEEFEMLKDLVKWTASIKPSNADMESKIVLLWHKILELLVRLMSSENKQRDLTQQVDFLVPYILHVGEDRVTTGLLGVIGLGRKSPLSPSFRFLSRALATFLSAQVTSFGKLRIKASSVENVSLKNPGILSEMVATQRTLTAFRNLESLRSNKTYVSCVEHVEFACKFIVNPENCLLDGPRFLKQLTKELFKDKAYLGFAVE
ncbi:ectopic P granules protein 5 homolog isoform X2 [Xenia sp. Carnegie-2017]|uniref:ectopic P granules protein 5 homolog isoform X2 n=1 Tax=Xenia sp. Carnegie-2017 TaxID=2897299 RepID=UPI001F04DBD9|nr:ectopic P granules protein 5 homolog isoform X2 [Xenia sp. Carnegie-2017]